MLAIRRASVSLSGQGQPREGCDSRARCLTLERFERIVRNHGPSRAHIPQQCSPRSKRPSDGSEMTSHIVPHEGMLLRPCTVQGSTDEPFARQPVLETGAWCTMIDDLRNQSKTLSMHAGPKKRRPADGRWLTADGIFKSEPVSPPHQSACRALSGICRATRSTRTETVT